MGRLFEKPGRDVLARASNRSIQLDEALIKGFTTAVESICPDLEPVVIGSRYADPCMEWEVAYVTALAKCDDDGIAEEDCWDALGPMTRALQCTMDEIEGLKKDMFDIWREVREPDPFPWPY